MTNLTFWKQQQWRLRETQVQVKVKRNEGKEIKAGMNSGVAIGWALLLCHRWDLTCGWDLLSSAELQERQCNLVLMI